MIDEVKDTKVIPRERSYKPSDVKVTINGQSVDCCIIDDYNGFFDTGILNVSWDFGEDIANLLDFSFDLAGDRKKVVEKQNNSWKSKDRGFKGYYK